VLLFVPFLIRGYVIDLGKRIILLGALFIPYLLPLNAAGLLLYAS
jgi:hypothetical protein